MLEGIPKISVLVITYNQEDVIARALDSLVSQKDYLYEVCVSDDCSKDKTWDILQEYSIKNPGLFKLNRNEQNIGIFENIEYTWTMPTGDVVYQLAGDDECGEGWFRTVVAYILEHNIDYKNDFFCIYGDYKAIYPNGDSFVFCNKLANTNHNMIRLAVGDYISNRSTCYSIKILNMFIKVSQGKSYIAEAVQDRQLQLFSKLNIYTPGIGNIYYTRIGVSSHINESRLIERKERIKLLIDLIKEIGYQMPQRDIAYLYYKLEKARGRKKTMIKYKFESFYLSFYCMKLKFLRIVFAILRRLPHKKPLMFYVK